MRSRSSLDKWCTDDTETQSCGHQPCPTPAPTPAQYEVNVWTWISLAMSLVMIVKRVVISYYNFVHPFQKLLFEDSLRKVTPGP